MNNVPAWAQHIIAAHRAVTDAVSHGERIKSERYFVWYQEDRTDFIADGRHTEKTFNGKTDLFTKLEFDPWFEDFEDALDDDRSIEWEFVSADFEDSTKLWHHQWRWSVNYGEAESGEY